MVYLILKLIHMIAAIIFLGNITIAPFRKMRVEKQWNRLKVADAFDGIIKADRYFTMS